MAAMAGKSKIAFIGLGQMGRHMASNLLKNGHQLTVFDIHAPSVSAFQSAHPGVGAAASLAQAVSSPGTTAVLTMLPSSPHVKEAYEGSILSAAPPGALLIDSSTINPGVSQSLFSAAAARGLAFVDAPVSGGVGGAEAGTLTFMCGGTAAGFSAAQPLLAAMGKNIVHVGAAGAGCAAKLCNNLILGASMLAVAEAMALGERLGVDPKVLAGIVNTSSGRCWSSDTYNPVPGICPGAPSSRNYAGGFATQCVPASPSPAR